jgi:hypothetical protein
MMTEGRIWELTAELRWVLPAEGSGPAPRLQQKWTEHYPARVFTVYGDEVQPLPGGPTGNFEWRDVPAVTEDTP